MKPAEGFLSARQAAAYVGYDVGDGPSREDPQMRAFYEAVRHKGVRKYGDRHRILFRRIDLDRAWGLPIDEHDEQTSDRLERMRQLGRQHAAGENVHA